MTTTPTTLRTGSARSRRTVPLLTAAAVSLGVLGAAGPAAASSPPTPDDGDPSLWETNFEPWGDNDPIDCMPDEGPLKAAWVYVGPSNDGGWSQAHDEARQAVAEHFGDQIETTYKENVPEGPQVAQVVADLIDEGYTLIFGTSFGFQDAFATAAEENPDVCFEFATGYLSGDNLSQFYGSAEDTDYLTGMAAAAASESGQIGMVASFPIPEVIRGVNAYALGVQSVNPDATVEVVWTNAWFDPALERRTAEALIADGADVIGVKSQDSPASGDAAQAAGVPWSGYDSDQSANYPDVWLTATTYHWAVYEIPRVQAVLDGEWVAGNYYGALNDGFVRLAPFGELVDDETRQLITERKAELAEAPGSMFTGPMTDNQGNVMFEEGQMATYDELMSMNVLVEGVIGEVPAG